VRGCWYGFSVRSTWSSTAGQGRCRACGHVYVLERPPVSEIGRYYPADYAEHRKIDKPSARKGSKRHRRIRIAAVLPDELVGAAELVVSRRTGARIGITHDRYFLVQPETERHMTASAFRAPTEKPSRVAATTSSSVRPRSVESSGA